MQTRALDDVRRYWRATLITGAATSAGMLALAEANGLPIAALAVGLGTIMVLDWVLGSWLAAVSIPNGRLRLRGYGIAHTVTPRDVEAVLFGNGTQPLRDARSGSAHVRGAASVVTIRFLADGVEQTCYTIAPGAEAAAMASAETCRRSELGRGERAG